MEEVIENSGPVTIDDVRKVLSSAEVDPRKTNSGAVRRMLGRGSMATIQRHLEVLRAELEPKTPALDGEIPVVPKELADALWRSAWTAAQGQTAQSLAQALLERDEARAALAAAAADLVALTSDADAAVAAAVEAKAAATAAATAAAAAQDALVAEQAERAAEVKKLTDDAAAAAAMTAAATTAAMNELIAKNALDAAHAETQIATLQGTIDRLVEQLAEVKSLLPRAQPPQV
jgi:hypothetical protein